MFNFLRLSPDRSEKVPDDKVAGIFKRRQVGVLIAACFSYIGYYVIRLVFTTEQKPIMKAYGFSLIQIGLILSTFGIGYGCAKLFMGIIADKTNPKKFLAFGLYMSCILNFILGTTRNFTVIMILMTLIALTQGVGAPTCHKLVNYWFAKKYRGSAFAVWSSAHNAGAFLCVASIQMATFLFSGSLTAVFWTASVVSAVIATLMLLINSDRPATYGLPTITDYSGEVQYTAKGEVDDKDVTSKSTWRVFVEDIVTNKAVWAISLTSMSFYLVRYGVLSWIPSYLPTKGFSDVWAKWFVGIFELSAVPGVILLGIISDLVKNRRAVVAFISGLGMVVCLFFYFTSDSKEVITVILFIMGSSIYAPLALVDLMVNEAVPKYAIGISTGFMGFFQYIFGDTVAALLVSILAQMYGWKTASIVIFVAAGVALLLLIYLIFRERRTLALERAARNTQA